MQTVIIIPETWSMCYATNNSGRKPWHFFNCSYYRQLRKVGGKCTSHYIRYDVLYQYVLLQIRGWSKFAETDEKGLLEHILQSGDREKAASMKKKSAELSKAEKRRAEVDRLFARLYEDRIAGEITEHNYAMLSQKYQAEQGELAEKIETLNAELSAVKQTKADAEKWIVLLKQYSNPETLDATLLNTMIEKIVVHEAEKDETGTRTQDVDIHYRFVGKIAGPENDPKFTEKRTCVFMSGEQRLRLCNLLYVLRGRRHGGHQLKPQVSPVRVHLGYMVS